MALSRAKKRDYASALAKKRVAKVSAAGAASRAAATLTPAPPITVRHAESSEGRPHLPKARASTERVVATSRVDSPARPRSFASQRTRVVQPLSVVDEAECAVKAVKKEPGAVDLDEEHVTFIEWQQTMLTDLECVFEVDNLDMLELYKDHRALYVLPPNHSLSHLHSFQMSNALDGTSTSQ